MTLVHGTVAPDDFVNNDWQDPRIQNLIQRTRHSKEEISDSDFEKRQKILRTFQPITNLTELPQVQRKIRAKPGWNFSPGAAQAIIDRIGDLENLSTIQQLTNLLRTN